MFIRIISIVICLFSLSAFADSLSQTPLQKFEIESAMNIFKDAENQNIQLSNLDKFIDSYNVSTSVRELVISYMNQGNTYSEFEKVEYGLYKHHHVKNQFNDTNAGYPNEACHMGFCATKQNSMCFDVPGGGCM